MNREIKLRVWDHRHGLWLTLWDDFEPLWSVDINDLTKFNLSHFGGEGSLGFTVQQYTGLKDKNGKEIYEGDIITTSYKPNQSFEVKFLHGAFTANEVWLNMFLEVEVIGNIFENSALNILTKIMN